jgi:hypothetical protein
MAKPAAARTRLIAMSGIKVPSWISARPSAACADAHSASAANAAFNRLRQYLAVRQPVGGLLKPRHEHRIADAANAILPVQRNEPVADRIAVMTLRRSNRLRLSCRRPFGAGVAG